MSCMVSSLQDRTPDEELQKVCLCQGWAVTQEEKSEISADVSEVGSRISQADTSEYFGITEP